jgi:hypothetical protein
MDFNRDGCMRRAQWQFSFYEQSQRLFEDRETKIACVEAEGGGAFRIHLSV